LREHLQCEFSYLLLEQPQIVTIGIVRVTPELDDAVDLKNSIVLSNGSRWANLAAGNQLVHKGRKLGDPALGG